jgi:phenylacetic acid degradation operon negative regulatory protein
MLRRATVRVTSPAPFQHPEDEWTLLSYSVPESRRDLRHRMRSRLIEAGFGGLRDGLWIAPGTVDVVAVLGRSGLADVADLADAFAAHPLPGTDMRRLVNRAWDVPAVRAAHTCFIDTWSRPPRVAGPLAQLTLLRADWRSLLRTDPGLPAPQPGPAWPAAVSSAVYRRVIDGLEPAARAALTHGLGVGSHETRPPRRAERVGADSIGIDLEIQPDPDGGASTAGILASTDTGRTG